MANAAGVVTVVLNANTTSFSAALTEAQRKLDQLAGKSKAAGHGTVSSMQAASASIRLLENPLGNNIRAIERLISQSEVLSGVMKAAFPIVGAIAIGAAVGKLIGEVAEFVKKVEEMPAVISKGFASLNLSATTAVDELQLQNDTLQASINKLQGKPTQNNLKITFDEAKLAADKLAQSIETDNDKLNELLSKNHLSALSLLLGKQGTAEREGTVKYYSNQQDDAGYRYQQAIHNHDDKGAAQALTDLHNSQNSELANVQKDLASRQSVKEGPNSEANKAIDRGVATNILAEQNREEAQLTNAQLQSQNKKLEAQKAATEQAKRAAAAALEAQKKAAEEQLKQWESDNSDWKAEQDRSLREDAAWWQAKLSTLTTGSLNYRTINRKVNADIIADNREYATTIAKFTSEYFQDFNKSSGLSGADTHSLEDQGKAAAEYIKALRSSIDLNRQNGDAIAESSLQMQVATGRITKLDAAQALANVHTEQFNASMSALQDAKAFTNNRIDLTDLQKQAQQAKLDNQMTALQGQRTLQQQQDKAGTNPQSSLGSVGFTDALNDFVLATRDAASQMRDITTSTLSSLNSEFVKGISGQRTSFGNTGAGIFRNIAGVGIQKAEGSILGAFGFGSGSKPNGTKGNPLYVKMADAISGALSTASQGIGSKAGGFLSTLFSAIPGFAGGGPVSPGTLAMVGENGPELAYFGSGANVIPNHQISNVMSGGGSTHHIWNIDASNSSDPAQTEAAVQRGIMLAAPHIVAASQRASMERTKRTPSTQR